MVAISTRVYFEKNVAYSRFNSRFSFQRLCRLLWGYKCSETENCVLDDDDRVTDRQTDG